MKTCCVCGKKLRFWQVWSGPTGVYCSSRCFIMHVFPSAKVLEDPEWGK